MLKRLYITMNKKNESKEFLHLLFIDLKKMAFPIHCGVKQEDAFITFIVKLYSRSGVANPEHTTCHLKCR